MEGSEDGSENAYDQDLDKMYITAYLELGPGEEKEVTFKYRLPASAVGDGTYVLSIQKQAGIDRELHRVTVNGKTKEIDLFKDTEVSVQL